MSGHRISLSPARRLMGDLMRASRGVPLIPLERRMQLAPLVAARRASPCRLGWCAIFTKALAVVAASRPELRRAYLTVPWAHLFEHAESVASIAIERRLGGEDAVLFELIRAPDQRTLAELQADIDRAKNDPIETIGAFRRELRLARLPAPLRRLAWSFGLNCSGSERSKNFGTFGVSAIASLGASQLFVRAPLTTSLYYGPFDKSGSLDVRLVFDHRVLDGATVARAMADMEDVLLDEILAEVRGKSLRLAA